MSKEIFSLTIDQICEGIKSNEFSVRNLVMSYIQRIRDIDTGPDGCNAILSINPDALFIAEGVDAGRSSKKKQNTLEGVPILIKANINTLDKMPTTGGTVALRDNYATDDAFVVKKLRKAGAVLLGKTNMTELANFMSYSMPGGYSSLGGQVKNFYNMQGEVGGSSSGSSVAMAAGLAAASLGTETNGSIIWPAQANGVVGLKPSMGLVSRTGILPICSTLDVPGPITRCVKDAAIMLNVIAGYDPDDVSTSVMQYREIEDYTCQLDPSLINGRRIGINTVKTFRTDPEQQEATERLIKLLKKSGAILVDGCDMPETKQIGTVEIAEFRCCVNSYFSSSSKPLQTLRNVISYNEDHPSTALRYGQARMSDGEFLYSGRMVEQSYLDAMIEREQVSLAIDNMFKRMNLDAILCTGGITNLAPFVGIPSMTVPIGYHKDGTPIGCCFVSNRFEEAKLLSIMYSVEHLLSIQH